MKLCQEFAVLNRHTIAHIIAEYMNFNIDDSFESIHNYISFEDNIVRKGAISAKKGEEIMIYTTGNTHSDFSRFEIEKFPIQTEMTKKDYVIICGDFGGGTYKKDYLLIIYKRYQKN